MWPPCVTQLSLAVSLERDVAIQAIAGYVNSEFHKATPIREA